MKQAIIRPKQFRAFRNKYVAALITVAAFFFSTSAVAQTRAQLQKNNAYGYNYINGAYRGLFYIPLDTLSTADSGAVAYLNGSFYYKNHEKWLSITGDPFLTASRIAFGNGSNRITDDPDFVYSQLFNRLDVGTGNFADSVIVSDSLIVHTMRIGETGDSVVVRDATTKALKIVGPFIPSGQDGNGFDFGLSGNSLTLTTSLLQGSVPFIGAGGALSEDNTNFFWDNTNKRFGIGLNTPGAKLNIQTPSLGVTQTNTSGLALTNPTAAAASAQQISPSIRWLGNGWKTNATAASQPVEFQAYVLPVQGTVNPTAEWRLESSINGAAFGTPFRYTSAGNITITGGLTAGSGSQYSTSAILQGFLGAASASTIGWTSRSQMDAPGNGTIRLSNATQTDFTRLMFGGTTNLFPSLQRSTTKLIAMLADGSARTNFGVLDEAYNATTWDGNDDVPTKNAIRDQFESTATADDWEKDGSNNLQPKTFAGNQVQITNKSFFLNGSTGNIPTTTPGTMMYWYPAKGAFRGGAWFSNEWTDANIGTYSFVFGEAVRAKGFGAFATGSGNFADGGASFVAGSGNDVQNDYGFATGSGNTIDNTTGNGGYINGESSHITHNGHYGVIFGTNNSVRDTLGAAFGDFLISNQKHQTVFGRYNDTTETDNIFTIAYGDADVNRKNVFGVTYDGKVKSAQLELTGDATDLSGLGAPKVKFIDKAYAGDTAYIEKSSDSLKIVSNSTVDINGVSHRSIYSTFTGATTYALFGIQLPDNSVGWLEIEAEGVDASGGYHLQNQKYWFRKDNTSTLTFGLVTEPVTPLETVNYVDKSGSFAGNSIDASDGGGNLDVNFFKSNSTPQKYRFYYRWHVATF